MSELRKGRVWLYHSEDETAFRARLAKALTEAAADFGTRDQIAGSLNALVDAVVNTVVTPPPEDRAAHVLECIQREPGLWTGQRAARALRARYRYEVTSERAVQLMRKLVERGQLVVANPPRGATFKLPHGPGDRPWYEWSTPDGQGNVLPVITRTRTETPWTSRPWPTQLLRRKVAYGPWVEVEVPATGDGDA